MFFIDYVSLMLLNMTAGFFVLAFFLLMGLQGDRKRWVAPFAMVGLVAFVGGIHMIFAWPLPGPYNSAFGETSVLLGVSYLGIALALAKEWNLAPLAIYGILAGLAAVVLGVRIINLEMTAKPLLSGVGFILSGVGGILAALAFCAPTHKALRATGALALILAAIIWAMTSYMAFWMHMGSDNFKNWKPATMTSAMDKSPKAETEKAPNPPPKAEPAK
jgi:putative membrane protein